MKWGEGRINKSNLLTTGDRLLTTGDRLLTPAENGQFYWAAQKNYYFSTKSHNLSLFLAIIENLGLKPRRSTTALLLNINTFTKYMLKCETWKKPTRFD
ncbi:MAG: hypothetical protein EWV48_01560, partial [Microcystis aeruginosa Ma_QC_C_20070823_S13]